MGPANLCEKYGLENRQLLKGVACAMKFVNPEDAQAVELQDYIAKNGAGAAIEKYTSAKAGSHMYEVILEEYNKLA